MRGEDKPRLGLIGAEPELVVAPPPADETTLPLPRFEPWLKPERMSARRRHVECEQQDESDNPL